MGKRSKRVLKDPDERRQELIGAADRLFAVKGYDKTAVGDIVKEVGVSQGTFYYYFDAKEDVIVAVLEKNLDIMERDVIQIAESEGRDVALKLNAMFNRFISMGASGQKIIGYIQQTKSATLHEKLMRIRPLGNVAPVVAGVIVKGVNESRFSVASPLETSYLLLMLLASSHHLIRQIEDGAQDPDYGPEGHGPEGDDHERLRTALEDLLGRALGVRDYRFTLEI